MVAQQLIYKHFMDRRYGGIEEKLRCFLILISGHRCPWGMGSNLELCFYCWHILLHPVRKLTMARQWRIEYSGAWACMSDEVWVMLSDEIHRDLAIKSNRWIQSEKKIRPPRNFYSCLEQMTCKTVSKGMGREISFIGIIQLLHNV